MEIEKNLCSMEQTGDPHCYSKEFKVFLRGSKGRRTYKVVGQLRGGVGKFFHFFFYEETWTKPHETQEKLIIKNCMLCAGQYWSKEKDSYKGK